MKKIFTPKQFLFCLLNVLYFMFASPAWSEGTKELQPDKNVQSAHLQIWDQDNASRKFATFDPDPLYRLNIRTCNVGEIIHIGFQQPDTNIFWRLKRPDGTIAISTRKVPKVGQAGYISTWDQAAAGPVALAAGGYTSITYTVGAGETGDFYIEFNPVSATVITKKKRIFPLFDITVQKGAAAVKGRLWSKAWDLQCNNGTNPFKTTMYIYSKDSVVTSINFNGMQPFGFVISANSTGCTSTGNPEADRKSRVGNVTYPEYPIFLNDPDPLCFPNTPTFGALTGLVTVTGCDPNNRCINIPVDKKGKVEILLDLDTLAPFGIGYNPNSKDRIIGAEVIVGTNCIKWDSRDGKGNLVNPGSLRLEINYFNGLTHLPLFDVEHHRNGYTVNPVRPIGAGTPPALFWDDTDISAGTALDTKTNFTGCAVGCHKWENRGDNNCATTCPETINTWWYGNIIVTKTNLPLNSIFVDANRLNPPAAKNDTTICSNSGQVPIHPSISGFTTTGTWKTLTGGTFNQALNELNGTYTPSATEKTNGIAILVLTSANNGICPAVTDTLTINIIPGPVVDAGPGTIEACKSNPSVVLNGVVSGNATKIKWTGGGSFVASSTVKNATHTPSNAQKTAGEAILTITTTDHGICPAASDIVTIKYTESPIASAGLDQTKCKNKSLITLGGSVANATATTTHVWSGGNGGVFSDVNSLTPTYNPSIADLNAGSVTLTLTATTPGCGASHADQITITFTTSPTANAGDNQFICSNKSEVTLAGSTTVATNGTWSSVGGAGTFSPNTLTGKFTPTAAQITSGSVKLVLTTTTGLGTCNAVTDTMTVFFTPAPVANAGNDSIVCGNNAEVTLKGTSSTGKGTWSNGCGTFVVNNSTLTAKYTPCITEVNTLVFDLYLSTDDNGNCNADKDTVRYILLPPPFADAGSPQTVCANNPEVTLAAVASGDLNWTGSGGSFSNNTIENPIYTPSPAEISAGTATLKLTANDLANNCNPASSTVTITIDPSPTANAGADRSVCVNNANVTLNGSVTGATSQIWTGGTGTFTPDRNTLNAVYAPSAAEKTAMTPIVLTLEASRAGCTTVTESMTITLTPAPTVDAGAATQTVCKNNSKVTLDGTIGAPATQATWTGGNGVFIPNRNSIDATYEPTAAEITAGTPIIFTLTSTDQGNCSAVSDVTTINFTASPTSTAGINKTVCADAPTVSLSGTVNKSTGGIWSGGLGTFTAGNTSLITNYIPTDAEVLAGTVTLTLTTTGNQDNCNSASSTTTITITPASTVDAGPNQTVCSAVNVIPLDGVITGASTGTWSLVSGTGTFTPNTPQGNYKPSNTDAAAGFVDLKLTSAVNGQCQAVSGTMRVTFSQAPFIEAGPEQTVCTNEYPIILNATGSPAKWGGSSGTLINEDDLNTTYIPSAAQENAGFVVLTITTKPVQGCGPVSDQVRINILPKPVPNAGPNQNVCGNAASIALNGTMGGTATGGFWTTNGNGFFSPNAATLNATYVPTAAEKASGATIINTLTSTPNSPCPSEEAQMTVTIAPEIVVSAGPAQTVCADLDSLNLSGIVTTAPSATWSIVSGSGVIKNPSSLTTKYGIAAGDKPGTVTFRLTSAAVPPCLAVLSDVTYTINPGPTADAGAPQTICADEPSVTLTGIPGGPATNGKWTTSNGTGTFSPSAANSNTTYFPSDADTTAGTVTFTFETTTGNGTCNPVSDQVVLTIDPKPVVKAGNDTTICKDRLTFQLNGKVANATGGVWTTSGNGTFNNANALNAIYTPSNDDKSDGTVTLTLESLNNGNCDAVQDQMIITFSEAPTVDAGPAQTVCGTLANTGSIQLTGSKTVATGVVWSGGGGSFSDVNSLTPTYTPSTADTSAGSVILTIATTGNGTCNSYQESVTISFDKNPIVNAGDPITVCADSAYVNLNGSVFHAVSGLWTKTGTGSFSLNNTKLNGKYIFSAADKLLNNITLTLTSDGNGSCAPVSATRLITITPAHTVTVGPDQNICADSALINITGSISVASAAKWTTSGNGTFGDLNSLNTTYTPSLGDKNAGTVFLTLQTTSDGSCKSVSKSMKVTIAPIPTANPGADQTVCIDKESINLNGIVTGAGGGTWTSDGDGGFAPNANTLATEYFIGDQDRADKNITLTLTTTDNGSCDAVSKNLILLITPAPTAEAGNPQTICADASGVNLNGVVGVTTTGEWSTTTGGNFSPSATALNAKYIPSATDKTNGSVKLILTTTGNGTCNPVTDSVTITITPAPTVDAGDDIQICADVQEIQLQGSVNHATGGRWETDGSGTFTPDSSSLSALYSPSVNDRSAGTVTLTLISTGIGTCVPVSQNLTITFDDLPTVNAGPNITSCANAGVAIPLNPTVTNASGGLWTTSGIGTFNPDVNTLNATYLPDPSEENAGSVIKLYLHTQGNGACDQKMDSLTITFAPAPSINQGPNKTVCQTDLPVQLEGSGAAGVWSSPGGLGTFSPNANTLNATFAPHPTQIGTTVTLTLTRPASGLCPGEAKTVDITITNGGPTVIVDSITTCTNATNIPLTGVINADVTGVKWTTASGTGTFSPNATTLNATFTPSPSQITAGVANLTLTTTGSTLGCKPKSSPMQIKLNPSPTVDAGFNQNVCASVANINLSASKTIASGVVWSKVTGTGTIDNSTSDNTFYTRSGADTLAGSITLRVKTTGNGTHCKADSADVIISFTGSPIANAGVILPHCESVTEIQLNGSVSGATGGIWTTSSVTGGTFSPNASALNAKYIPSAADKTGPVTLTLTTSGTGACPSKASTRVLTFINAPVLSAGPAQNFCSDVVLTPLAGSFSNAGGIKWTSTGTGSFADDEDPLSTYTPSAQDKTNGGVNLTITTTGSAPCAEIQKFVTLSISPAPSSSVNAGLNQEICKDAEEVQLQGIITIAGGGKWTKVSASAGGSFFPNDSTLTAKYIPSPQDTTAGIVTLRLTTTNNGICNAAFDEMNITFTETPKVTITNIPSVCSDVEFVQLGAAVTIATGGEWSSSGSGFFSPNQFTLNAKYFPSDADFANGSIGLTLTSTGNGTCNPGSNSDTLKFIKMPTVFAGDDVSVCSDAAAVSVTGVVTSAFVSTWSTSGTGTFDAVGAPTTNYRPSPADVASTRVIITLTSTGPGSCNPVVDKFNLDFTPAPTVKVSPAQTICEDAASLSLNGAVTVAGGGLWTTSGSGTFTPSSTVLNASYNPSQADKDNNTVTLTLTSTDNGTCGAVDSSIVVSILNVPEVSSGVAVSCAYIDGAPLTGATIVNPLGVAGQGIWTSTGTGAFAVSAATTTATYFPSMEDIAAGSVTLTLTSLDNAMCGPVSASSKLFVGPLPLAEAGGDQFVCVGSPVNLIAAPSSTVTYEWLDNAGTTIGTNESVTVTAPNAAPANTFIELIVTDARECISRDTVRLTTYTLPTLNLPTHACLSDTLVLDAAPTNLPVVPGEFQWFRENVIMQGENDFTLVVKNTGKHTIRWSFGSAACQIKDSTIVTAPPVLKTVDSIIACVNQAATLTTLATPSTGITYLWSKGTNPIAGSNAATITDPSVTAGTNTYFVKATDPLTCFAVDSIKVLGIPVPTFAIEDTISCQDKTIVLDGELTPPTTFNVTYKWKRNNVDMPHVTSSITVSPTSTSNTIPNINEYVVIATIDQCAGTDTAEVTFNPLPADISPASSRLCIETDKRVVLDAGAGAGYTYEWKDESGTVIGTAQTDTVTAAGFYFVTINNTFNCPLTDSIEVKDICKPKVFIPTAFSPDGKGNERNERLEIFGNYFSNFKLTIFNRWGEIIFYTEDPAVMWDGTYRGEPMPVGVYPYILTYDGLEEEFKGPYKAEGAVTVVR